MRAILLALVLALLFAVPAQAHHDKAKTTYDRHAAIIYHVFGKYGSQAVTVAKCESRLGIWARNGQYLGMFQMGSSERARFGHGNNPWAQAQAAWKYFALSGKDWSPWSCKPW